jgi:hypothetical protein
MNPVIKLLDLTPRFAYLKTDVVNFRTYDGINTFSTLQANQSLSGDLRCQICDHSKWKCQKKTIGSLLDKTQPSKYINLKFFMDVIYPHLLPKSSSKLEES